MSNIAVIYAPTGERMKILSSTPGTGVYKCRNSAGEVVEISGVFLVSPIAYKRTENNVNALCERERKESKALNSEVESGYESWL